VAKVVASRLEERVPIRAFDPEETLLVDGYEVFEVPDDLWERYVQARRAYAILRADVLGYQR
jgi:hypothetical protein